MEDMATVEPDQNFIRQLTRILPEFLQHQKQIEDVGKWVMGELDEAASYTDRYAPPRLETHNAKGQPVRNVILNPRYQAALIKANELILRAELQPNSSQALSFVYGYLLSQSDISVHCPVTMSGAVIYVLKHFAPKAVQETYLKPLYAATAEALPSGGTWCTELHGGSDIGASTTHAVKHGDAWQLHGLKWFTSNAGSGLALATARPEGAVSGSKGIGLYLVPSHLPDGAPNAYTIRRLKDKLGTRGLPTGEIDLNGCYAIEVAPPPHGLRIMMYALGYSRLHNAMGAAGVTRRCFVEAYKWAREREVFGKKIIAYPMVQETLLDLQVQNEASLALAMEAARVFPKNPLNSSETENGWSRFTIAAAKFLTDEMAVDCSRSLLRLVGGNGYTEEFPSARIYRDTAVLIVWEGPENIQALELLRVLQQYPNVTTQLIERIESATKSLAVSLEAAQLIQHLFTAKAHCLKHFKELKAHPEHAEVHAKRLLEILSKSLTLTLLAEEYMAEHREPNSTKLLIANRYAKTALSAMPEFSFKEGPVALPFAV